MAVGDPYVSQDRPEMADDGRMGLADAVPALVEPQAQEHGAIRPLAPTGAYRISPCPNQRRGSKP